MDTSIDKEAIDRIYGSYEDVYGEEKIISLSHKGLFSRQYFHHLETKPLTDLIHQEFGNCTRFAPVTEGSKKHASIQGDAEFAPNTPVYLCVRYDSSRSDDTVHVGTSWINQTEADVYDRLTNNYILVYKVKERVSVALMDLTMRLNPEGVVSKVAHLRIPNEKEYYSVLSSVRLWDSLYGGIKKQVLEMHKERVKQLSKALSDVQSSRTRFAFFVGQVDQILGINSSLE